MSSRRSAVQSTPKATSKSPSVKPPVGTFGPSVVQRDAKTGYLLAPTRAANTAAPRQPPAKQSNAANGQGSANSRASMDKKIASILAASRPTKNLRPYLESKSVRDPANDKGWRLKPKEVPSHPGKEEGVFLGDMLVRKSSKRFSRCPSSCESESSAQNTPRKTGKKVSDLLPEKFLQRPWEKESTAIRTISPRRLTCSTESQRISPKVTGLRHLQSADAHHNIWGNLSGAHVRAEIPPHITGPVTQKRIEERAREQWTVVEDSIKRGDLPATRSRSPFARQAHLNMMRGNNIFDLPLPSEPRHLQRSTSANVLRRHESLNGPSNPNVLTQRCDQRSATPPLRASSPNRQTSNIFAPWGSSLNVVRRTPSKGTLTSPGNPLCTTDTANVPPPAPQGRRHMSPLHTDYPHHAHVRTSPLATRESPGMADIFCWK